MAIRIAVLGGTGMLGSMLVNYLRSVPDIKLVATTRSFDCEVKDNVTWTFLDAEHASPSDINNAISGAEVVVNAIGVIKPMINEQDDASVHRALNVNACFPHLLAVLGGDGVHIIQPSTDCVFSGMAGPYYEDSDPDPVDLYGKSKSRGEPVGENVLVTRCSLIGPEQGAGRSLMSWFLARKRNEQVRGFNSHYWNGVTTLHYAKLVESMARFWPGDGVHHIVPADSVTKYELLGLFARHFGLDDITIESASAGYCDRRLSSQDSRWNDRLWRNAGWTTPPFINEMIYDLKIYMSSGRYGILKHGVN